MDLKWWPVAALGSTCFVAAGVLAALLPMTAARRRLRPLANIARLTRLPEYAKVARLRSLSTVVTLVVLTVMFGAAAWAAARPTAAGEDFDAAPPEDIMLCVGQPLTDVATVELLDDFAQQASAAPQTERIGLTSVNRRLVPLTRDHQYAAARFAELRPRTQAAVGVVRATGAVHGLRSERGRCSGALYFGFSPLRAAWHAPALGDLSGALGSSRCGRAACRAVHRQRRAGLGRARRRPTQRGRHGPVTEEWLVARAHRAERRPVPRAGTGSVVASLNEIRAHMRPAHLADGTVARADFRDAPVVPLSIGLLSATVLSVALMGLRR